jgi:hypothetical protein
MFYTKPGVHHFTLPSVTRAKKYRSPDETTCNPGTVPQKTPDSTSFGKFSRDSSVTG